jgi:cytochrome c oxidase subunit II
VGLLLLVGATAGCATPLSTLDPASSGTAAIATLWWVMLGGAALILLGVTAAFVYSFKKRRGREVPEGYFLWGGGLVFPAVVLTALMAFALPIGQALLLPDDDDLVRVEAIGNQWWWSFVHPDAPQGPVHAAVDLHIPAGRTVEVTLTSDNVIHSFWVPRVTWKLDVVPGHANRLRLQADEPGVYQGVCAEFCGLHHAHMQFRLIAHAGDGYEAYLADATGPAVAADHPGAADFVAACSGCHSVDPLEPSPGPHLHRLRDRRLLGGVLPYRETADLRRWLREHESLKPGSREPSHDLIPDDELERIIGYLESAP